ncbi:MAG TPA: phenylphosphate synthase subunit beta [Actinobacteria bacterium]|nr:phenylphosphate synthase subunit beta [Actinomycetota bacterium]
MNTDSRYLLAFEDCLRDCLALVGGKSTGLGSMIRAGIPVPPGFAVTTHAYRAMLADGRSEREIAELLDSADPDDVEGLEKISRMIGDLIESSPMPADVESAIRAGYEELDSLCSGAADSSAADPDLPVAVRSSATAEDLPGASFAGQQDTFLWVVGADSVLDHVKRCWSSLYTARAIAYRIEQGYDHEKIYMSVCIQKMVNARAAGVMFTLNPINGDRSKVAIDASWGLGEAVASGEVTPDNYLVDTIAMRIARRTVSSKAIEYRANPAERRVERTDVPVDRRDIPCLGDDEILALSQLARRVEAHHGCPQDLEWAIDADLEKPNNIVLLQSRPETVWSDRDRVQVSSGDRSTMDYIVANLLAGVRWRLGNPDTNDSGGAVS